MSTDRMTNGVSPTAAIGAAIFGGCTGGSLALVLTAIVAGAPGAFVVLFGIAAVLSFVMTVAMLTIEEGSARD